MTTKIEWTDETWNPVTGCTKVSDGCKHCYAERLWCRLSAPGQPYQGRKFTDVQCHPDRLDQPLRWTKPRMIFVNSMSDLFHEDVPFQFIADVFAVMSVTTRHTYQILTKRPERMLEFFKWAEKSDYGMGPEVVDPTKIWQPWTPYREGGHGGYDNCGPLWPCENVWLGVSVENQQTADERIPLLLQTPAFIRWVSVEPLLGPVELDNVEYAYGDFFNALDLEEWTGRENEPEVQNSPGAGALIDWVVLGGESGPKARPMHPEWVRSIRDQCQAANVPFFFKQWGEWMPVDLDIARNVTDWMIVDKHGDIDIPDCRTPNEEIGEVAMRLAGKKKAGRTLDGRTWEEYPNA